MPRVEETIPIALAGEAEAARAWFAKQQGSAFKLTGIVDPEASIAESESGSRDLQLILCGVQDGQDVCLREKFRVTPAGVGGDYLVDHLANARPEIGSPAPELDPPLGVRANWIESTLQKHAFVVLLFYRGFW